jgi:pyroglutamyl-peptidase
VNILLTGFGPFDGLSANPSQVVADKISGLTHIPSRITINSRVLSTEYLSAGNRIVDCIHELRPDAVLIVGVAPGSIAIRLERVALNIDDSDVPDLCGEAPQGRPIAMDGPVAYRSTLPLERFSGALREGRIPFAMSNHAGTYVCNHVFYLARHVLESSGADIPCGLIHIPLMLEQVEASLAAKPSMPLNLMVEAIAICIKSLQ